MNALRCPDLDRVGRELIDTYRNLGDQEIFAFTGIDSLDDPV